MPLSLDELKKLLEVTAEKLSGDSYVKVGFVGTANRRKTKAEQKNSVKIGAGNNNYMPTNLPLWKLALYNHKTRPFLAETAKNNRGGWEEALIKYLKAGDSVEKALAITGSLMVGDVRKVIRNYKTPPNSPKTLKRKRFNTPLIDSATMLKGVSYQVVNKKGDK